MSKKMHAVPLMLAFLLSVILLPTNNALFLARTSLGRNWTGAILASKPSFPSWNRTFGGILQDYAYSLVQTSDNGFASAGATHSFGVSGSADFWLVKTDSLGIVNWTRTYGGTGNDEAHSVVQTSDGGFAILGTTDSFGAGDSDFWLVKTDPSGNMLWNKTYGGTSTDDGWSIKEAAGGNLVLAGWTASFGAGSADFWLVKTDSNGNVLWNKTYGGPLIDFANSVQQTSDGGFILFGSTYSFSAGGSDFYLVKVDASGNEQWSRAYGGPSDDYGFSAAQIIGGYALLGSTSSYGAGVYDFWLIRTDQFGNMIWNRTYGGSSYDEPWSMLHLSNGDFLLSGWTESSGAGASDCWLVETDESGNMMWNVTWGGANNDYAYAALQTNEGNLALTGSTESYGAGSSDLLLIKGIGDIGVIAVDSLKTVVTQGYSFNISVTVTNYAVQAETFNADVKANSTTVGTQSVFLNAKSSAVVTLMCSVAGLARGSYVISAIAEPVKDETDTSDNTFLGITLTVAYAGDANGDGVVDIIDIVMIAGSFGVAYPSPAWRPNADINNDGVIDILDIVVVASHYGQIAP